MATSNISTLVRNSTAKVNHAINSTQVKTRTILAESKVKAGTKGKPWTNSLWACCVPFDLCLKTTCCMCVTFGKTNHRIENDGDMTTYKSINGPCAIFAFIHCYAGLGSIYQGLNLYRMRQKYDLEGSIIEDVFKAGCCTCCSIIQAEKESKLLLGGKRTDIASVVDEQYTGSTHDKMIMAPLADNKIDVQPTPLTRISEETPAGTAAQASAETDAMALYDDDNTVRLTTVIHGQNPGALSATDDTLETTNAPPQNATMPDTVVNTGSTGDAVV